MAEVLGPLNLLNKALPLGVDGTRLAEWAMADGVTYGELANRVSQALGDTNQMLVSKWGFLFSLTEEMMIETPNGGSITPMRELTDMDKPEPVHGTTIGHMVDLRYYGNAIGGTKRYFRDVRSTLISASIGVIVNQGIWRFEQKLFTRFFTNTENAIGAAGYDVPFVRGSGGNIDFIPPAYDGATFDATHDHFIGYNLSTPKTFADVFNGLALTLAEHGHEPPFDAIVSRSDVATISALTRFVQIVSIPGLIIDRGGATSGPIYTRVGDQSWGQFGEFQADNGLIRLHASARIPTGVVGMSKSYGQLDARNSLVVRVHPKRGFGMAVVPETTPDDDFPIKQLDVDFEFGTGVGADRTNGSVGFLVAGGVYANPTIS